LACAVVVAAVVIGVWRFANPGQRYMVVTGSVQIVEVQDGSCGGTYDGISRATQVTITDRAGNMLSFSPLETPAMTQTHDAVRATVCTYPFTVRDVPKGMGFYMVMVGNQIVQRYHEAALAQPINLTRDGG